MRRFIPVSRFAVLASCLVVAVTAVAVMWVGVRISAMQPYYTNKTEAQQWADVDRWQHQRVDACNRAGGQWIKGCTVNFIEPDISGWYEEPVRNPHYDDFEVLSVLVVVLGLVMTFTGPAIIVMVVDAERLKREERSRIQHRLRTI